MRSFLKIVAIIIGIFLLTGTAFGAGLILGGTNLLSPCIVRTTDQPEQFSVFWEAWNLVQDHFVDRAALDPTMMTYGAIRGMVSALGDTGHTSFLTPQEHEERLTSIEGKFTGIGAQLGENDGLPIIVAPFDGSPAQKAGVKPGDVILEVDGEEVRGLTLTQIAEKVRGPADSQVTLTLYRPDENRSLDIVVTRGEITIPAVTWSMVPGTQAALIRLSQFSGQATDEMVTALSAARAAGATSLVVDVRNNPGGLLDQAVRVTSQFLKEGNVLLEEDAQGNRNAYPVVPDGQATDLPLVVLVNPGTASSSEIFAGAIQDYTRGQVVGETTFGTGTVLQPYTLQDGSELLLGVKQWLTPNGRLIRNQGIQPDVVVELSVGSELLSPATIRDMALDDIRASQDTQMLKALELLKAIPATP
ncbi:MAG: S41 family peptidase [Caldilineaceae bacterium]|nr:S41 family peptidase [Caldilineaceae bacterium]